jgi:hypothetical protein
MCFLELTKDEFLRDPTKGLINSIDPYHSYFIFNPHAKLKEILQSPSSPPSHQQKIMPDLSIIAQELFNNADPLLLMEKWTEDQVETNTEFLSLSEKNSPQIDIFRTSLLPADPEEAKRYQRFNTKMKRGHSLIVDGDNVEWSPAFPVEESERWGFYSNYHLQCFMWGKKFLQLLETYYWAQYKGNLPPCMDENSIYRNFSDLVQ